MATLKYRPNILSTQKVVEIAACVAYIVAGALTCDNPEGCLSPKDVEVEPVEVSPLMMTRYDIYLLIEANDYPERAQNLDERTDQISKEFKKVLDRLYAGELRQPSGCIRVRLSPGAFRGFC